MPKMGKILSKILLGPRDQSTERTPESNSKSIPHSVELDLHPVIFLKTPNENNILFNSSQTIATRSNSNNFSKGIVIVKEPLVIDRTVEHIFVVQILQKDACFNGSLGVGITVVDQVSAINISHLQSQSDEYGLYENNVAPALNEREVLIFSIGGKVSSQQNKSHRILELRMENRKTDAPLLLEYELEREVYLYFNVYGSTCRIRAFSTIVPLKEEDSLLIDKVDRIENSESNPELTPKLHVKIFTDNIDHYSNEKNHVVELAESAVTEEPNENQAESAVTEKPKSSALTVEETSQSETSVNGNRSDFEKIEKLPDCKICMDEIVNAVLTPCAHMCLCENCAIEFMGGIEHGIKQYCPICRSEIDKVMKVYL